MPEPVLPKHRMYQFGPYLAEMEVDPDYCKRLLKLGKKLTRSHRENLAGQIYNEYLYDLQKDRWIAEEFQIYINTWIEGFKRYRQGKLVSDQYSLNQVWINFQKRKEYNPQHVHTNCDLSFVLWLEVPQKMLNEAKKNITNGPNPGHTVFTYGEDKWSVISERVFTPTPNRLVMFPGDLRHHVMHFNSNVTRTSVAGNISFIPPKHYG